MVLTPAMRQYMEIKNKYKDCIILFRMGDFYEMFYEDAKIASRELNIVLTSRGKGDKKVPLAGIPYHAVSYYIAKLIKKGYKLAICEQLEDPKKTKGIVKRGVTRIITPGTVIEENILDEKSNNYLIAINKEGDKVGLAITDISTGEFFTTQLEASKLMNELIKFSPKEIIIPISLENSNFIKKFKTVTITPYDDKYFWYNSAYKTLTEHFNVLNLHGFGLENLHLAVSCCGALLSYLKETQRTSLSYINRLQLYSPEEYMIIDATTQRNLELLHNIRDHSKKDTLFEVLDKTLTPMGTRLLKKWLLRPLMNIKKINERLDAVEELVNNTMLKEELRELLKSIYDIERIISRVTYGSANAKDLLILKTSLKGLPEIKSILNKTESSLLKTLSEIPTLDHIVKLIEKAIKEEPAPTLKEGNIIKEGYNKELDELRAIAKNAKELIRKLEEKERRLTGIKSLKIKYNKVFGYFIEVTKPNLHLVPRHYIRKQTQVNTERFITEELKGLESKIVGAEEKIVALEYNLFHEIVEIITKDTERIQQISSNIAILDCLLSFATVAIENNYSRPIINISNKIVIKDGRHPVVEQLCDFVPNDLIFDESTRMMIITGPNMSGKSTYMRQNALIILMAQIGSFVPARYASIPIVDRIFTRVGAFDDITLGQSTFMVEMTETANILHNATEKSFIILDEIGRGTSTYDGVSLAWAVAEYIYTRIKAKTLFATHYHQLNKLAEKFNGIKNYNIAVDESQEKITFLYKIVEGGTDKSYGIYVAKLAGLPNEVIKTACKIMIELEKKDITPYKNLKKVTEEKKSTRTKQLSLSDLY